VFSVTEWFTKTIKRKGKGTETGRDKQKGQKGKGTKTRKGKEKG
jgi:hypothetical protein